MKRLNLKHLLVMLLAIVLIFQCGIAQRHFLPSRKKAVDRFLTALLVKKDLQIALQSIDDKVFEPEADSSLGCFGFEESNNPEQNKLAFSKEIREEFLEHINGKTLREVLFLRDPKKKSEFDVADHIQKMRRHGFLNIPKRDRYYLASYKALISKEDRKAKDWQEFRKLYDLRGAFFLLFQLRWVDVFDKSDPHYDEPYIAILWVRAKKGWKIAVIGCGPTQ